MSSMFEMITPRKLNMLYYTYMQTYMGDVPSLDAQSSYHICITTIFSRSSWHISHVSIMSLLWIHWRTVSREKINPMPQSFNGFQGLYKISRMIQHQKCCLSFKPKKLHPQVPAVSNSKISIMRYLLMVLCLQQCWTHYLGLTGQV